MLVKSKRREDHCVDLQQTFDQLQHFRMKLNLAKGAFDVFAGKFLGFLVTKRGIEIDPTQIKTVQELHSPRNKKELQCLTGKTVAIAHFISQYTDRLKPFFNVIKKAKIFEWKTECKEVFLVIKSYLISSLILKSPQLGYSLYMYIVASKLVVSTVLLKLGADGSQLLVYYVSEAMLPVEQNYILPEKGSVGTMSGLKEVVSLLSGTPSQCLNQCSSWAILHKPELSGQLVKWVVELSEFGLRYLPRLSLKGQVLILKITKTKR